MTVGHNVFVAKAAGANITVDLWALRRQVISRVHLVAGYGLLMLPGPLGGEVPIESQELDSLRRTMSDLQSSISWRVTRPLRAVRNAGRRSR